MPMYEYLCDDCGYSFERVQSFHDEPLTTCPECEGTVRRLISAVGIIFKGSGWYITDSKRQISSGTKSTADKTATGVDSKDGGAADAKAGSGDSSGSSGSGDSSAGGASASTASSSEGSTGGGSGSGGEGSSAAKPPAPKKEASKAS